MSAVSEMDPQDSNLTCIICFERFRIPVTIPCGHTFCQECITKLWDTKSKAEIGPQCPLCQQEFPVRPDLKRNVSMSELTEAANTSSSSSREVLVRGGDGGRAMPLCDRHKKPMVYYCRQDKMSVCCVCAISECAQHKMVMLETERESQEMLLERKSKEVEKLTKETQKNISDLSNNISNAKVSIVTSPCNIPASIYKYEPENECDRAPLKQLYLHFFTLQSCS
ncbi:tripartite motif-containing protein 65-like [Notothenia coriiceps]|uniref:Tripartite motif-containing protein 65-like n=1 Tax=Notothenia coriiceps TaxID=8208 RepID=A0A6I9Q3A6_9TELE|nr:PREDICTED: tripartite motif-containing protein 65-like [Notothenia coriiceps]